MPRALQVFLSLMEVAWWSIVGMVGGSLTDDDVLAIPRVAFGRYSRVGPF